MMFILFMKTVDVYLKEALIHAVMGETPVINFNWRLENNCTELAIFASPEKINQLDENILEVYLYGCKLPGSASKIYQEIYTLIAFTLK